MNELQPCPFAICGGEAEKRDMPGESNDAD